MHISSLETCHSQSWTFSLKTLKVLLLVLQFVVLVSYPQMVGALVVPVPPKMCFSNASCVRAASKSCPKLPLRLEDSRSVDCPSLGFALLERLLALEMETFPDWALKDTTSLKASHGASEEAILAAEKELKRWAKADGWWSKGSMKNRPYYKLPDEGMEAELLAEYLSYLAVATLFEPLFRPASILETIELLTYSIYTTFFVVGGLVLSYGAIWLFIKVNGSISIAAASEPVTLSFLFSFPGWRYIKHHAQHHIFETPLQPRRKFASFVGKTGHGSIHDTDTRHEIKCKQSRWRKLISRFLSSIPRISSFSSQSKTTPHGIVLSAIPAIKSRRSAASVDTLQKKKVGQSIEKARAASAPLVKAPTFEPILEVPAEEERVLTVPEVSASRDNVIDYNYTKGLIRSVIEKFQLTEAAQPALEDAPMGSSDQYGCSESQEGSQAQSYDRMHSSVSDISDTGSRLSHEMEALESSQGTVRSREELDRMRSEWVRNMPLFGSFTYLPPEVKEMTLESPSQSNTFSVFSAQPTPHPKIRPEVPPVVLQPRPTQSKLLRRLGQSVPMPQATPEATKSKLSRYFDQPYCYDRSTVNSQASLGGQPQEVTPPPGFSRRYSSMVGPSPLHAAANPSMEEASRRKSFLDDEYCSSPTPSLPTGRSTSAGIDAVSVSHQSLSAEQQLQHLESRARRSTEMWRWFVGPEEAQLEPHAQVVPSRSASVANIAVNERDNNEWRQRQRQLEQQSNASSHYHSTIPTRSLWNRNWH